MDEAERATDFSIRTIMGQEAKVTLKGRCLMASCSVNAVRSLNFLLTNPPYPCPNFFGSSFFGSQLFGDLLKIRGVEIRFGGGS